MLGQSMLRQTIIPDRGKGCCRDVDWHRWYMDSTKAAKPTIKWVRRKRRPKFINSLNWTTNVLLILLPDLCSRWHCCLKVLPQSSGCSVLHEQNNHSTDFGDKQTMRLMGRDNITNRQPCYRLEQRSLFENAKHNKGGEHPDGSGENSTVFIF